ncbi:prolyl aminopeptidase [Saccharothrix australiensis]|uniref:prolyl aminopeptidase n=1 Tax=Saccharothrix australiensis TaxID=2072 RepID=UPI001B8657C9|nr:prolyl aminopeptidase [Saccharothrix australiensis]
MAEILYPPVEPYEHGMLDVGGGDLVYWEACGNPDGKPALVVHGGPGSGCTPAHRRFFDPARYRVVLFDQRGCGRSMPRAGLPGTSLRHNTTAALVADMELLREHLGVERWLLTGASWGSTLLLAYAEAHPDRVSEVVITAVTTTRRAEIDWLYRGLSRFFPAEWRRFRDVVPPAERGGDLTAAYGRLLADPDPEVRARAAKAWHAWEDATISLDWNPTAPAFSDRPLPAMLDRARICTHYFANDVFLADGVLLADAAKLTGIPGVLLHGRLDLGSPVDTAWELAEAWPDARLEVFGGCGHAGTPEMSARKRQVLDEFARA